MILLKFGQATIKLPKPVENIPRIDVTNFWVLLSSSNDPFEVQASNHWTGKNIWKHFQKKMWQTFEYHSQMILLKVYLKNSKGCSMTWQKEEEEKDLCLSSHRGIKLLDLGFLIFEEIFKVMGSTCALMYRNTFTSSEINNAEGGGGGGGYWFWQSCKIIFYRLISLVSKI